VRRFDAIVVGAGPAGSTAAYRLARAGARVVLIDRARFPRDKPCGGGLSQRAVRLLPVPVDPVVEQVVRAFEFRFRYGRACERRSARPLVLMTQRRRLDAFLAERAAEAGAEFRDRARLASVDASSTRVRVTVDGRSLEGDVLVGADGVNGVTARALALAEPRLHTVALEGNLDGATPRGPLDRAVIELGTVAGGYGWLFPKTGHVNVGVWGWSSEGPRLRQHLAGLCHAHGYDPESLRDVKGYRLPLRPPGAAASRGRAVLVGDAAGLVDPFSGDGIYEALLSARLASEAVLDLLAGHAGDVRSYSERLAASLGPLAASSWALKRAFERFPRLSFAVTRAPFVWNVAESVFCGDLSQPGAARGAVRVPLRLLDALGANATSGSAA
jgi:geranylgeranyl reductase family protein